LVFSNLFVNTLPIIFFYMFLYNMTLIGFFWILMSFYNSAFKTLHSFNIFSFESSYLFFITVFLFSLAGVPPFMGFFSKVYLLNLLVDQSFFLLYSIFIVLLIFGLYFYMQNLRFLHSTNHQNNFKPFLRNERKPISLFYYLLLWTFFLINGVFFIEDILVYFVWLVL
jgi:NADH-quinone oxidoreductase subunit N